jgi:phosphoglycolate phosphatase
MSMRDTKLIICDWSGVISDDRELVYASNMHMCDTFGLPKMSYEEWLPTTTASAYEWFATRGVNVAPEELIVMYEAAFKDILEKGARPSMYPDAPYFLKQITAECPAIVVSAHPQPFLEGEAVEYGIDNFFRTLYGSSRNKVLTIQQALQDLRIEPRSSVMVGDAMSDIRSAKAAGVGAVGITTGYHTREQLETQKPDLIVSSLTEFARLME